MSELDQLDSLVVQLTEIFKDELLLEPAIAYSDYLRQGFDSTEFIRETLNDYIELLEDYEHYGHYTYIAFALFLYELGRLKGFIKKNALKVIENDIKKYDSLIDPLLSLDKLIEFKIKLESEQPKRVKIKIKKYYDCGWEIGSVFAYKITEDKNPKDAHKYAYKGLYDEMLKKYNLYNKYIMFKKVGEEKEPRGIVPIVSIYNWYGDEPIRDLEEISKMDSLATRIGLKKIREGYPKFECELYIKEKEHVDKADLIYIGKLDNIDIKKCGIENGYLRMHCFNVDIDGIFQVLSNSKYFRERLIIDDKKIVKYTFKEKYEDDLDLGFFE